jgi:hypothetical protein
MLGCSFRQICPGKARLPARKYTECSDFLKQEQAERVKQVDESLNVKLLSKGGLLG